MSNVSEPAPQLNVGASVLRMLIGAVLGGGAIWFYYTNSQVIRWSDGIAIAVALICFIAAARLLGESFDAKKLSVRMDVEGDPTRREVNQVRLQCILLVALGVSIVWPVIATAQNWPAPIVAYAVTAVFIVIRVSYTLLMWRSADEFVRSRVTGISWWTFFISQTALIAYAGAERLGLMPPLTAWDIMVSITGISILVSALAGRPSVRRA